MSQNDSTKFDIKKRIESIDTFRGFTIFAMIFVIMVAGYRNLPLIFPHFGSAPVSTFKHASKDGNPSEWAFWEGRSPSTKFQLGKITQRLDNNLYNVALLDAENNPIKYFTNVPVWTSKPLNPEENIIVKNPANNPTFQQVGIGCTFTDLVAPFFVFIVGLVMPFSLQRRGVKWWKHVGIRTLGLIFLGVVYISLILNISYWWGILQAIGIAYFMGAVFMMYPISIRWLAVILIAIFHSWATWYFPWWVELGDKTQPFWTILRPDGDTLRPLTIHCTPWASISYGLITIVGTIVGQSVITKNHKIILRNSLIIGIALTIIGYLLHLYHLPMNKDYVSSSYAIFTSGVSALFFIAFYWVIDVWGIRGWGTWFFNVFGINALLAYFLQPVVRIFTDALGVYAGLRGHSGWDGMLAGLSWTLLLWCIVYLFNRKNIYWKL